MNKTAAMEQITFCAALREKYRPEALDDEFENIVIAPRRRGKCFFNNSQILYGTCQGSSVSHPDMFWYYLNSFEKTYPENFS